VKWHDVEQNSGEWFALRCGKITASNAACFMANEDKPFFGEPAKRYALQIALERINGRRSDSGFFSNAHTERGHEQEPIARMLYEELHFVDVGNGGFFDHGHCGSSPDGLVGDDGVIEIKCVIAPVHYATIQRGSFDPAYTWQLISHLDCTGRDWVDFVSYCAEFPYHNRLFVSRLYKKDYQEHISRLHKRRSDLLSLIDDICEQINSYEVTSNARTTICINDNSTC